MGGGFGLCRRGPGLGGEFCGALESGLGTSDQEDNPSGRGLCVEKLMGFRRRASKSGGGSREAWISIRATRPWTFRALAELLGEDAAETQGFLRRSVGHPSRRTGVAECLR